MVGVYTVPIYCCSMCSLCATCCASCFASQSATQILIVQGKMAVFLMGIIVFGGIGIFLAKDYIRSMLGNVQDDYESDGEQRTRIRHEGNL